MSSIRRSVQVMELLARRSPMGVRAIAGQLGLPLGSVHRLLLDLEQEDIAERNGDGEWQLSFRLLEITGVQLERIELPTLCRPFAERIAATTGETVNLNVLSGLGGVCIDKVRGNTGMQLDLRIGSRAPLYCGGAGKAMLAYLPEETRSKVANGPLPGYTPQTLTDATALTAELARIRSRGYAIDNQEIVAGVFCVAVPILDAASRPIAALSITGATPKAPGAEIQPLVAMLNEAAGHVSRRLGYRDVWPPLAGNGQTEGGQA